MIKLVNQFSFLIIKTDFDNILKISECIETIFSTLPRHDVIKPNMDKRSLQSVHI